MPAFAASPRLVGVLAALVLHGLLVMAFSGRFAGMALSLPAAGPSLVALRFGPAVGAAPGGDAAAAAARLDAPGPGPHGEGTPREREADARDDPAPSATAAGPARDAAAARRPAAPLRPGAAVTSPVLAAVGARIQGRILRLWKNTARGRKLRARYLAVLNPEGGLVSLRVEASSGDPAFDLSAERALVSAAPFDEVQVLTPAQFEEAFRELRLEFDSQRRLGL